MVDLADHVTAVVAEAANGPDLIYAADARDDATTLRNLVEIGRIAGPLHRDARRLASLIERLASAVETGTVGPFHRSGIEAALRRIEEAQERPGNRSTPGS